MTATITHRHACDASAHSVEHTPIKAVTISATWPSQSQACFPRGRERGATHLGQRTRPSRSAHAIASLASRGSETALPARIEAMTSLRRSRGRSRSERRTFRNDGSMRHCYSNLALTRGMPQSPIGTAAKARPGKAQNHTGHTLALSAVSPWTIPNPSSLVGWRSPSAQQCSPTAWARYSRRRLSTGR
jgi:hypothetical protein